VAPRSACGCPGKCGDPERQIERDGAERQQRPGGQRKRATAPQPAPGRRRRNRVGRRDQPPRDFDTSGFRLALADQTVGTIALDLFELVAVDRDVVARGQ
jgi:hypothetical protein